MRVGGLTLSLRRYQVRNVFLVEYPGILSCICKLPPITPECCREYEIFAEKETGTECHPGAYVDRGGKRFGRRTRCGETRLEHVHRQRAPSWSLLRADQVEKRWKRLQRRWVASSSKKGRSGGSGSVFLTVVLARSLQISSCAAAQISVDFWNHYQCWFICF